MSLRTLLDIPDGVPPKSRAQPGSGKAHQERPPADRARRGASAHLIARHTPKRSRRAQNTGGVTVDWRQAGNTRRDRQA
jgi:hypothetical protein